VNKPDDLPIKVGRDGRPVFISYATADRKEALAVCKALERRGTKCWIATRDVQPGENYQEAIVRAIRQSRALVLVFSEAANNSDEIKKELSLVSRFHVPLMALRIEDVEPSDAFAYELSTRQWIDAFDSWDKSLDSLVRRIGEIDHGDESERPDGGRSSASAGNSRRGRSALPARTLAIAAVAALILLAAAAAWLFLRPGHAAAHSMVVRLTGFQRLSPDLPASMPNAMGDEIIAAFNDDGVVGVSTAAAPPPGDGPAYALGGTVRRDGDKIKVNVRLTNERSGTTLWSNMFSYDSDQQSRVPRRIAIDAGNMVRCGLFAASTYRKALSDAVLADYLQYCNNSGFIQWEPGKALDSARKVVAAAPDFSWGWSAVAGSAGGLLLDNPVSPRAGDYRKQAVDAADKAIALDKSNSEALDIKALLLEPRDLIGRETLLKQALDARPLACGCEHHLYGIFLQGVGRNADAIEEFRRSTDVLALDVDSQFSLADSLLIAGKTDEAKAHLDAAADLAPLSVPPEELAVAEVAVTGDYAAASKALQNPKVQVPAQLRAALQASFQAMASGDSTAKSRAVQMLAALPPEMQRRNAVAMLAALGANREAMQIVERQASHYFVASASWLYLPVSRGALKDPGFPAFAQRIGLIDYWQKSKTRPDFCSVKDAPPVCRMI
jgi:tetratricopeptide (TPR) repeat protein